MDIYIAEVISVIFDVKPEIFAKSPYSKTALSIHYSSEKVKSVSQTSQ